ncbi:MAG: 3-demethylubiquinone-9 3-methyltransferase [Candidatus Azambacteria bacterium GW2011_GWA2_39_10]|uniref:3-demethylubiquinone-9 3-methyltransferase n=1 Tax=Candidatus Azambacteria bacterium GW2011_GWA2_39_10 TaxID=1618611 RepID=A0A0G0LTF8_9BACT|nr:MAG: 3-demethylubiquinone-9 3-methyltransferase [Candidatus Azambacteria bacterium GW2011_GWA2_39_10]
MNFVDLYKKIFSKEIGMKGRIFSRSPLSPEETQKIWEKYFRFMPVKLVLPLKKYNLNNKKVLDIGSAWGEFLIHFGPDSKGIEVMPESVKFSQAIGLNVDEYNFEDEWREESKYFDAIWCSNVLEHVVAPHLLLRRFHDALKPNGLIFIRVPTIPSNWLYLKLNRLLLGFLGYEAVQHINAFTRRTIEFTIERAGFKIIESNIFFPQNQILNKILNPFLKDAISFITIVAKKTHFKYPEKRLDMHNPNWLKIQN